jgi:hypothetical protein
MNEASTEAVIVALQKRAVRWWVVIRGVLAVIAAAFVGAGTGLAFAWDAFILPTLDERYAPIVAQTTAVENRLQNDQQTAELKKLGTLSLESQVEAMANQVWNLRVAQCKATNGARAEITRRMLEGRAKYRDTTGQEAYVPDCADVQ